MTSYDPPRHRYAVACACATTVLLVAGGLVTSTGSGLSVPDWPLSFGGLFPRLTGGVLFEHGHRLIAATVGLLTIGLALWFAVREKRAGVRRLAWLALASVVAQGLLGGLTVLLRLPPAVSVLHACLAQAFFCMTVVLALVTSRGYLAAGEMGSVGGRVAPPWIAAAVAAGIVYLQLILGAVMRHTGAGLAIPDVPLAFGRLVPPLESPEIAIHFAHRVLALVVAAAVLNASVRALRRGGSNPGLAGPAVLAIGLVVLQILLGAITVATRLAVVPATAHVLTGALLLATLLVLALRGHRGRGTRRAGVLRSREGELGALAATGAVRPEGSAA